MRRGFLWRVVLPLILGIVLALWIINYEPPASPCNPLAPITCEP